MGDFTITYELGLAFQKTGIQYYKLKIATPEQFYNAIGKAKESNPHGAFVTQHSIEEYSKMRRLFLTMDETAGIAITQDNNIVSIFNGGEKHGRFCTPMDDSVHRVRGGGDAMQEMIDAYNRAHSVPQ